MMASCSKVTTRLNTRHSVFDQPEILRQLQLPLKEDIFKCYLFYRNESKTSTNTTPTTKDLLRLVADDVIGIWRKANIPCVSNSGILKALEKVISKGQELQKYPTEKRRSSTFQNNLSDFQNLFDICPCKCRKKGIISRNECKCAIKVPSIEWDFWVDQTSDRKLFIGGVDREVSRALEKRGMRKHKQYIREQKHKSKSASEVNKNCSDGSDSLTSDNENSSDSYDLSPSSSSCASDNPHSYQNRLNYPELCQMMERTGISNRDACKIVNTCLKDMGLDKPENLLEATKLRRQRAVWRSRATAIHSQTAQQLICVGFDGRIDETRLVSQDTIRRTKKQDHYVIISFPGEHYVDHVAPQTGKAADVTAELLSVLHETNSIDTLCAVLSDGTNVNTGEHNGIIRSIEAALQRPLQWLICMLHLNELPFREVFKQLDGETVGPVKLRGVIGKKLEFDSCSLPVVNFQPVAGNTVDVAADIMNNLSHDQKYLLRVCLAVQVGYQNITEQEINFLNTSPPSALNHARWLTRANRTVRLYMATLTPTNKLVRLVRFIVTVYAPCWFYIKSHPSCTNGSSNFYFMMQKLFDVKEDAEVFQCAKAAMIRNCYFAHAENVFLTALVDENIDIRRDAANKIICCRKVSKQNSEIRKFSKTHVNLNWDADNYYKMIDWSTSQVTLPPLLQSFSDDNLLAAVEIGPVPLPDLPCHSQSVERAIKEVTKASAKVFGHKSRHGMIVSAEQSRIKQRKFETKKSFIDYD